MSDLNVELQALAKQLGDAAAALSALHARSAAAAAAPKDAAAPARHNAAPAAAGNATSGQAHSHRASGRLEAVLERGISLVTEGSEAEGPVRPRLYPAGGHAPAARLDQLEHDQFDKREVLDALKLDSFEGFYNLSMQVLVLALIYIVTRSVRDRGVLLDWTDFTCPQVWRDARWAAAIIATAGAGSFLVHGLVRAWIHRWLTWATAVYAYVAYQTMLLAGVVGFCYASPIAPLPTATALLLVAVIMLKSHSFVATNYAIYCEHVARYGTMLLESRLSPRHSHHGRPVSAPAGSLDAFVADAAAASVAASEGAAPATTRPHSTAAAGSGAKGAAAAHASSAHGGSPARAAAAARRRFNSSSSAALAPPDSARSSGSAQEDGAHLTRSASRGQLRQRRRAKVGSSGSLAAMASAHGKARAGSSGGGSGPADDGSGDDDADRPSMDAQHHAASGSGSAAYHSDSRDYGGDNEREDSGTGGGAAASASEAEGKAFSGLSPLPSPTAAAGTSAGGSSIGGTSGSHLPQPLTLPSTAATAGAGGGEGGVGLSVRRPPPALDVTAAPVTTAGNRGHDEGGGDTPWPDHGPYADVPAEYANEVAAAADGGGGQVPLGDGIMPPLLAALGGGAQPDIISGTREQKRRLIKAWPHNVTVRDFAYFLLAPTLVYEPRYPRTKAVRWRYVAHKSAQLALTLAAQYALLKQFLLPTLQHPSPPSSPALASQAAALVFDVMRLAIPSLTVWLLMFYSFFHCAMNITAELLRFADRYFYSDWWNATRLDTFWRSWNRPVHEFALRHVFVELRHYAGVHPGVALFATFFISAVGHELIFSVAFKTVRPWFFLGMLLQIPLIFASKRLTNKRRGNTLMWWSLFLGQVVLELLYIREYFQSHDSFFCAS